MHTGANSAPVATGETEVSMSYAILSVPNPDDFDPLGLIGILVGWPRRSGKPWW